MVKLSPPPSLDRAPSLASLSAAEADMPQSAARAQAVSLRTAPIAMDLAVQIFAAMQGETLPAEDFASAILALRDTVDTLITVPNQRLMSITEETTSMINAFKRVDMVLLNAVQGISDLITFHGIVNVDFADVCTIMSNQGLALMGSGRASGSRRAQEAATQAISSP